MSSKKSYVFHLVQTKAAAAAKQSIFFSPKTYVKKCIHHYFLQLINFIHKL